MARKRGSSTEAQDGRTTVYRRSTRVTKRIKVTEDDIDDAMAMVATDVVQSTTTTASAVTKGKGKAKAGKKTTEIDLESLPVRFKSSWKVGAHVSAAGGVENSLLNAAKIGANSFALFLKSQRKWTSPPLTESSISTFKERMKQLSYDSSHILPHGSYLINLGNPDEKKREKSYECFLDDIRRCDQLGLLLYNFHPGSTVGAGPISASITLIAESINRVHRDTPGSKVVAVIENMAGAGNIIGGDFTHLGQIIEQVEDKTRVGVCLDTCHMFAAGYDIRTKEGWNEMMGKFEADVGLKYLRGMHINDSKMPCASNKDRHENIGLGHLKIQAFENILTDPRVQNIPLVLETPSHEENTGNWDVWKKEIEVLNRISAVQGGVHNLSAEHNVYLVSSSTDDMTVRNDQLSLTSRSGPDSENLEELTEEIRQLVESAASSGKAKAKKTGQKKGSKRKRKEESEEESEDEE